MPDMPPGRPTSPADAEPKPAVLPATRTVPVPLPKKPEKKPAGPRDHLREGLETIVFVVVLVFLLKQFVVEAFVIPTGSMAETLYGYQKVITCPDCGFDFALNSSVEVDPQDGVPRRVQGYCCPNCRYKHAFTPEEFQTGRYRHNASGDRVLVNKWEYHAVPARRGDVVVFKYPKEPQKLYGAQNYIKRRWGAGGETLAIWRGDLYATTDVRYPADARDEHGQPLYPRPDRDEELWRDAYMYSTLGANRPAVEMWEKSLAAGFPDDQPGFKLVRKDPAILDAMKRLVWDNDHPSAALAARGVPARWSPEAADWTKSGDGKSFTHAGGLGWLRYRHYVVDDRQALGANPAVEPRPVDNFLGYNAEVSAAGRFELDRGSGDDQFWVGDLIIECRARLTDPAAEVILELSRGPNRFQAKFAGGQVELLRTGPVRPGEKTALGSRPSGISGTGSYTLRLANVDSRLRVWADGRAIDFGTDADYAPLLPDTFDPKDFKKEGWVQANDVDAPASVGAAGGVEVGRLKLWRDTYFIPGVTTYSSLDHVSATVQTYYVQPGHSLCLGDNSAQSSDSRVWGVVPDRLMLGRAAFVFFPLDRIGFIK